MTSKEGRQYAMLVRVRKFGEGHQDLFPDSSVGGQAFASVATAVAQLSAHVQSKLTTAREGRASKKSTRLALIRRLDTIGRTARLIAEESAGFDDPFRLPQLRRQNDETLLSVARSFAKNAGAAKARFIAHDLPKAFVTDLEGNIEDFEEAVHGSDKVRTSHTAAQTAIAEALASGLAAVKRLDVHVANKLQDDPNVMSVWRRERRIGSPRVPQSRKRTPATQADAASVSVDAGTMASTVVVPSSAPPVPPGPVTPAPATVSPAVAVSPATGEADSSGRATSTDVHSKVA